MPPVDPFAPGTTQNAYLSLSAAAKALTRFLFDDVALPSVLQQHGVFLLIVVSGATATAFFRYLKQHRQNRKKIETAVFHILRMLENHPHYQAQLQLGDLHHLIRVMEVEVERMIDTHLNKGQAASAMAELKRKVCSAVDEGRARGLKRRMIDGAAARVTIHEQDVGAAGLSVESVHMPGSEAAATAKSILPSSTSHCVALSASPLTEAKIQTQLLHDQEELEDSNILDVDDLSSVASLLSEWDSTTPAECSSPAMSTPQTPCPRPSSPPREGYGLDYDSRSLYSTSPESSPSCSPGPSPSIMPRSHDPSPTCTPNKSPPHSPNPSNPRSIAAEKFNILKGLPLPAFEFKPIQLPRDTSPLTRKSKKAKLSSPKTRAGTQMLRRHLFAIPEGNSPHVSPEGSISHYRVNETRRLYEGLRNARQQRRGLRNLFKQGEMIARALQELADPSPCSEVSRDLPTDDVYVLKEAVTPVQEQLSSPCSEASRSSSPSVVSVADEVAEDAIVDEPATPASPAKKAARSPKTPRTPPNRRRKFSDSSAEVRRSARKGTFKGKYTN